MNPHLVETEQRSRSNGKFLSTPRPILFSVVILSAAVGIFGYRLRTEGIFACQANGYQPDRYLAYCQALGYGDYDHGAFWFDLESSSATSATAADVLMLGNSRMQVGFSTDATADWFSAVPARYYILGLIHMRHDFQRELLSKLDPKARVYVINVDAFFDPVWSDPALKVTRESDARSRYEKKRLWQLVHSPVCGSLPALCADNYVVFRSRQTGAWVVGGGDVSVDTVSYDSTPEPLEVGQAVSMARTFLTKLPVTADCVVLTMVPHLETKIATSQGIARALGMELISPQVHGLQTFDKSHLDRSSAERWSEAFFQAAGPQIDRCLSAPPPLRSTERLSSGLNEMPGALR